jgi:hypothetical protein
MNKVLTGKGLKRTLAALVMLTLLFVQTVSVLAVSDVSLTREDIATIIEETARRKNIPPEILKAVAWIESRKTQFTSSGAPFVSRGNRGLMQINNVHTNFDSNLILYDVEYNIEAGADILLSKWLDSRTPVVGNRDPNTLEHWYFALWAYNGWLSRNNPNLHGEETYQDRVFDLIRTRYGQEVSTIDWSYIPVSGLPQWGLHLPEPSVTHEGGILFFQPEDRAIADVRQDLYVLKAPNDDVRFTLRTGDEVVIASEPHLEEGLYWYEILHSATGQRGWVAGIYLKPVFVRREAADDALWSLILDPDIQDETEPAQMDVKDKAGENPEGITLPDAEDKQQTDEVDLLVMPEATGNDVQSVTDTEAILSPPHFSDMINHPAREAVETLTSMGVISTNDQRAFRPHQAISRQEMAVILDKFFNFEDVTLPIETLVQLSDAYTDGSQTSSWALAAMSRAASLGVIGGYPDGAIRPLEVATREQGIVMLVKSMHHSEQLSEICASQYFKDGSTINHWALPAVNVLLDLGIFEGLDHTCLNPQQELTRVELAVVLYRIHRLNNR